MRWIPGGTSRNVEDRRGSSGMGMGTMGIGGTVLLVILSLIFGRDFVTGSGGEPNPQTSGGEVAPPASQTPEEAKEVKFVSWVLDTTQATWAQPSIWPTARRADSMRSFSCWFFGGGGHDSSLLHPPKNAINATTTLHVAIRGRMYAYRTF